MAIEFGAVRRPSGRVGVDNITTAQVLSVLAPIWHDKPETVRFPPYRGGMLFEEELMSEIRRRYDPEFKSGAVRIVLETGKPIAQVARDLGVHAGTLGNWMKKERLGRGDNGQLGEDGLAELVRLRKEVAELRTGA
jgi:transposase